jgi:hypothetical protein
MLENYFSKNELREACQENFLWRSRAIQTASVQSIVAQYVPANNSCFFPDGSLFTAVVTDGSHRNQGPNYACFNEIYLMSYYSWKSTLKKLCSMM